MHIVVNGDYSEVNFTMILSFQAELNNNEKCTYMDEVIGEIFSTKHTTEILRHLEMKIREGFIGCDLEHSIGSVPSLILNIQECKRVKNTMQIIMTHNKKNAQASS